MDPVQSLATMNHFQILQFDELQPIHIIQEMFSDLSNLLHQTKQGLFYCRVFRLVSQGRSATLF